MYTCIIFVYMYIKNIYIFKWSNPSPFSKLFILHLLLTFHASYSPLVSDIEAFNSQKLTSEKMLLLGENLLINIRNSNMYFNIVHGLYKLNYKHNLINIYLYVYIQIDI